MTTFISLFAILLVFLYILVCVLSGLQSVRIIVYGHSLRSFQFGFLTLGFLWTSLRVIFFGQPGAWPTTITLMLLWYPVDLQFAMFTLLVVFYANLLHKTNWERSKKIFFCVYIFTNIFIIVFTTGFILLGCDGLWECQLTPGFERTHHLYMALQFFFLVAVYTIYGYKLATLDKVPYMLRDKSSSTMVYITILASLLFSTRFVYNLMAAFNVINLDVVGTMAGGDTTVGLVVFALLFLWEILPTLAVLVYFRHIPKTNALREWSCCRLCPFWGYGPYTQEERTRLRDSMDDGVSTNGDYYQSPERFYGPDDSASLLHNYFQYENSQLLSSSHSTLYSYQDPHLPDYLFPPSYSYYPTSQTMDYPLLHSYPPPPHQQPLANSTFDPENTNSTAYTKEHSSFSLKESAIEQHETFPSQAASQPSLSSSWTVQWQNTQQAPPLSSSFLSSSHSQSQTVQQLPPLPASSPSPPPTGASSPSSPLLQLQQQQHQLLQQQQQLQFQQTQLQQQQEQLQQHQRSQRSTPSSASPSPSSSSPAVLSQPQSSNSSNVSSSKAKQPNGTSKEDTAYEEVSYNSSSDSEEMDEEDDEEEEPQGDEHRDNSQTVQKRTPPSPA